MKYETRFAIVILHPYCVSTLCNNSQSRFSHKNFDSHSIPARRIGPSIRIVSTIGSTQDMTWIHDPIHPPSSSLKHLHALTCDGLKSSDIALVDVADKVRSMKTVSSMFLHSILLSAFWAVEYFTSRIGRDLPD
jgi:hypothetical protein